MKKVFNIKLLLIILTGILLSGVSVSAAIKLSSLEVNYDNKESKLTSNDVQKAIDELNEKINEKILEAEKDCPEGQICTKTWNFDYTGGEQVFTAPKTGKYNLEIWGAQGADFKVTSTAHNPETTVGGYGAYSNGMIELNEGNKIYIYVGGRGQNINSLSSGSVAGYPNGGYAYADGNAADINYSSGGGSTHISLKQGLISQLTKENIIIVAGGGGGACGWWNEINVNGGNAGGYIGGSTTTNYAYQGAINNAGGGTQSVGGKDGGNSGRADLYFGKYGIGSPSTPQSNVSGAGGGGYYGGGSSWGGSGGGGSGYIGNSVLTNKSMYCYECQESNEISTKTISTTNVSETPISEYAKKGNGYARITYYLE